MSIPLLEQAKFNLEILSQLYKLALIYMSMLPSTENQDDNDAFQPCSHPTCHHVSLPSCHLVLTFSKAEQFSQVKHTSAKKIHNKCNRKLFSSEEQYIYQRCAQKIVLITEKLHEKRRNQKQNLAVSFLIIYSFVHYKTLGNKVE